MCQNCKVISITWGKYKPLINQNDLEDTLGPGKHPDRKRRFICLEDLKRAEKSLTHSKCAHSAHKSCLKSWMEQADGKPNDAKCPMCRQFYTPAGAIHNACSVLLDESTIEVFNLFSTFWFDDEDILQIMRQASEVFRNNEDSSVDTLSIQEKFCGLVKNEYDDFLENMQGAAERTLAYRIAVISGQAEDSFVGGKSLDQIKREIASKWKLAKDEIFAILKMADNKLYTPSQAKLDILKAVETYAQHVRTHGPFQLPPTDKLYEKTSKVVTRLKGIHLNGIELTEKIAEEMIVSQCKKEQSDYHARTGRLWPEDASEYESPFSRFFRDVTGGGANPTH